MFAIIHFGNCNHLVYIKMVEDEDIQNNSATRFSQCEIRSLAEIEKRSPLENIWT